MADTHIVVGARACSKVWDQLWAHWQLQGSWLLACTTTAAGYCHGHMAVGACNNGRAGGCAVAQLEGPSADGCSGAGQ